MAEVCPEPAVGLTDDELFCSAASAEEAGDRERAFALFGALMRREDTPGRGHFSVGRLLLERNDESGMALIEGVMQALPWTVIPGCELIIRFLLAAGRDSEVRPYIDRYRRQQEIELS